MLIEIVARYETLAEFKRAPEAPQYREVLRVFGSWARARSLVGDWAGEIGCAYALNFDGIWKVGSCARKTQLLAWGGELVWCFEGTHSECIAREVELKQRLRPISRPRDVPAVFSDRGYYLAGRI
jgi:hypothetical protein